MRRILRAGAPVLLMAALSACTAVEKQRGYVPDPAIIASVQVGKDTKETVSTKLGNPSMSSTFDNDVWYYYSSKDTQAAFFAPHSTERDILAVEFKKTGEVADIRHYGLEDGRFVDYVSRETPTRGRDMTILQQIFNAVPGTIGQGTNRTETNPGDPTP
jgi:outer membrane protein assembly factor BamE (lipoprotein component of BamABCDE complex)